MRVERPGYFNASQVEDDTADEIEEQRRTKLLQIYEKHILQSLCPHIHYNPTLSSFYQRQCLPRLRKFAELNGLL